MERVLLESVNETNKKILWIGSIEMSDIRRKALLDFHAFTGNDYVSAFFSKAKFTCWKKMETNKKCENFFEDLATAVEVTEQLTMLAEGYVVQLYGGLKMRSDTQL